MLTLHRAAVLVADPAAPPIHDGAVLVDGATVAAIGPYRAVAGARERAWGGLLVPGLCNPHGQWLLERAYHPDPREELGSEPLTEAAAAGLFGELDQERRGGSARRGLQRMLAYGTTAVAGPFELPVVRTAVARSGLVALDGDGAEGGLDPLAGTGLAQAVHRPLAVGGRADFAVFDVSSVAELESAGAGRCLATVLGGRLLYRRR
ncbi:amidohydrolase family protein [Kitasatospora sp. HPMI-4]|uniref:amidohydrolase family protein n=1 Tax=Kitasatospora sp. HPMI-4 TaxID=3448443 RepID=UPI003F19AF7D